MFLMGKFQELEIFASIAKNAKNFEDTVFATS